MKIRFTTILGLILIAIGLKVLLDIHVDFDWYWLRSYGFLIIGLLGMFLASPQRSIVPFVILTLGGLYFLFSEWGLYYTDLGLNVSIITMVVGLALMSQFIFRKRSWLYFAYGITVLAIGTYFLVWTLGLVPTYGFRYIVDDYWPVIIIVIGIFHLINAVLTRQKVETDESAPAIDASPEEKTA